MTAPAADPRIGAAVLEAVAQAHKALDRGNPVMMQHAVGIAIKFLDLCDPDTRLLVLHRLIEVSRRCPPSEERDELLAKAEAILGPCGNA